jgi:hypothetical protein
MGANRLTIAEFLTHEDINTANAYIENSPAQAEIVNQALGQSPVFRKLDAEIKRRSISSAQHAQLEPDKQIMNAPNGHAIVGIGGCAIGQSFCTKTPALACYTCPKFMFLRDDVEVHRNALAARHIVREFLEASPAGATRRPSRSCARPSRSCKRSSPRSKGTVRERRFLADETFTADCRYRKVAETPGLVLAAGLSDTGAIGVRALEPERHRRHTGHQALLCRAWAPTPRPSPRSIVADPIAVTNPSTCRPAPRLAGSGPRTGRQAPDRREEESRTRGQQRRASGTLPGDLLLSQRALGDHGRRPPQALDIIAAVSQKTFENAETVARWMSAERLPTHTLDRPAQAGRARSGPACE